MKLYVLFAQRECRYEGEYAPEAVHVVDEFSYDENPHWLNERLEEAKKDDEFVAAAIVPPESEPAPPKYMEPNKDISPVWACEDDCGTNVVLWDHEAAHKDAGWRLAILYNETEAAINDYKRVGVEVLRNPRNWRPIMREED